MTASSKVSQQDEERMKSGWQEANLSPLWEGSAHRPTPAVGRGHHWRWTDIKRFAHEAAQLTSPEIVERRVLRLVNPQPSSLVDESTVGTLAAAIQILLPGEKARPHRHSINALRFVLEGTGAQTVVNGVKVDMQPGDMLLTPGECWHEHMHVGDEPVIWLDVLDAPLHTLIGTETFEPGPVKDVPKTVVQESFSSPNIGPATLDFDAPYSPVFRYPYADMDRMIDSVPASANGARVARYKNPVTGGAVMSTIDCQMVTFDVGSITTERQDNADTICLVVEGEGESWVGADHFEWSKFDIFSIPGDVPTKHLAHKPVRLFTVSNREMLRRLDLLKETPNN